jgi:hypothetical protein
MSSDTHISLTVKTYSIVFKGGQQEIARLQCLCEPQGCGTWQ